MQFCLCPHRNLIPFLFVLILSAFFSASGLYAQEEGWSEALSAARDQFQSRDEASASEAVTLSAWYKTAVFANVAFDDVALPEQSRHLNERNEDGGRLWLRDRDLQDGIVNSLTCGDGSALYLARTIRIQEPILLNIGLGSDDGIKVWLNGTLVHSNNAARVLSPEADTLTLPLLDKDNFLVVKIYNVSGGCGFYFNIRDDGAKNLWRGVEKSYPQACLRMAQDLGGTDPSEWIASADPTELSAAMVSKRLQGMKEIQNRWQEKWDAMTASGAGALTQLQFYQHLCESGALLERFNQINREALRLAVEYLVKEFPDRYAGGRTYLDELAALEAQLPEYFAALGENAPEARDITARWEALQRTALLANPLLDFEKILLVKRHERQLGLPQNWQGNCSMPRRGYDNELALLDYRTQNSQPETLFRPEKDYFVGDVDLHFDGDRMLFSMIGSHNRWQIWELNSDGTGLRQVTPGAEEDVDNYDACYLPDGRIIYDSTLCMQGIPCVTGSDAVANLCIMNADGSGIRQLCFDQDHDWCPTVLNNGRILFSRWEYSDTPHYFTRVLFHMNPDGTNQVEYYGSNSFWPNSMFYTRPIPNNPSQVVTIVSGHHGVARMGELVLLDSARGRHEASGVVQRIPGRGQPVEPVIEDQLVDEIWPKFLHPYPLSEHFFLVSCKPSPPQPWGIYLVDTFDNMLLLHEEKGYALFEPLPFRAIATPPAIPDRVNLEAKDASVYLMDVYAGEGLKDVPPGTVKALRVYSFHYCYQHMGGHEHVGVEGPWDVRRILGTVPVMPDGSAFFKVPANTPIAVQPLDSEGKALQVMRSWFTAMPGEVLSCVGCHEPQNTTPSLHYNRAARRTPDQILPWYGLARGFSFHHEIQPVLDRHCAGCHDRDDYPDGRPNLSNRSGRDHANFTLSYLALHPFVRRPGPESDYHLQIPLEWHADTSELIQMLKKGHHGVQLDTEAWDRLTTWIDLNVPDHGRWTDHTDKAKACAGRRAELRALYACTPEDNSEADLVEAAYPREFVKHEKPALDAPAPALESWPFDRAQAEARQAQAGSIQRRTVDLGNGTTMEFALIPAGKFVMGGDRFADEYPRTVVEIEKPFWLGTTEVTNEQYRCFNPAHDSRYIDQHSKDHTTPGYPANEPLQPVIRVSWNDALAFTQWLSEKLQVPCTLPTEAQWEWACRAGTDSPFYYGGPDTDFSAFANLADLSTRKLAVAGVNPQPIANPNRFQDFFPKDARFDDGQRIVCVVGMYEPNVWGLFDMHGNVSEWTLSAWRPYPYQEQDGRNNPDVQEKRVVRGGSWSDRPKRARSEFRLAYEPWQGVFNVGFRVALPCTEEESMLAAAH